MSNQNKTLMLRWYDEVWNNGNEKVIDEILHADVKAHGLAPEPLVGPHAFKPFYKAFTDAYADIKVTVDKNLTDGNYVTTMCSVTATHKATKTPVKFSGVSVGEFVDGKLINGWNFFDFLSLNVQIGNISLEQLR
jgi:hypothetical protein